MAQLPVDLHILESLLPVGTEKRSFEIVQFIAQARGKQDSPWLYGQVMGSLARLERENWITYRREPCPDRPDKPLHRHWYRLTEDGHRRFHEQTTAAALLPAFA